MHPGLLGTGLWRKNRASPSAEAFKRKSARGDASASEKESQLVITIPETLNYSGAFDDLFEKYTKSHKLTYVKASNMGSLYKLTYKIELKSADSTKEFIDELRQRNGNLEISLFDREDNAEEL